MIFDFINQKPQIMTFCGITGISGKHEKVLTKIAEM